MARFRIHPERFARIVQHLIGRDRETEWIEFKLNNSKPDEIGENISALANSAALLGEDKGYIVWGISEDDRSLVGTTFNPDAAKVGNEELENWLLHMLEPHVGLTFHKEHVDDRVLVVLEISAAVSNVVRFKREAYIRSGSYTKPLRDFPEKERRLWESLRSLTFESGIAGNGYSAERVLASLDTHAYYDLAGIRRPTSASHVLEQLENLDVIRKRLEGDFDVTNLGAILFAKHLTEFGLERKALRVVNYSAQSRAISIRETEIKAGYAAGFPDTLRAIDEQSPQVERIRSGIRRLSSIYPDIAVRELVANSLIHQDFAVGGSGPMVEVFPDRMEITNPGTPLIPADRFLDLPPRSRNEKLGGLMRTMGICEERGSGVDKVITAVEAEQLPAPDFRTTANHTRVVLFAPRSWADMTHEDRIRGCYQHACLQWESNAFLTNASLRTRFALADDKASAISRLIKEAVDEGRIRSEGGSRRDARYVPYYAKAGEGI
jgi:ATP-dependent DNA helicase RecG